MGRRRRTSQECLSYMTSQVITTSSNCHEWQRAINTRGYGQVGFQGKLWMTHRLVWTLVNGDIPKDMVVCHRCDNPKCINPNHLFLGTMSDNSKDSVKKGRWKAYFTCEQADIIRKEVTPDRGSISKIARKYGVSPSVIGRMINNKTY